MAFDRLLIDSFRTGWQNNVRAHMIADDAFFAMRNCNVYRQRVVKRFGSQWFGDTSYSSRLRMVLTPALLVVTTPINLALGMQFTIGTDIFTVVNPTIGQTLQTNSAVVATITAIDQVTFSAIADTVYFYPALPVMGIRTFEQQPLSNERFVFFDTRFAYQYNVGLGGFERLAAEGSAGASEWSGDDSQFFWTSTWRGLEANERLLFTTNYSATDGLRYLDASNVWQRLPARYSNADPTLVVETARIVVVFKNRLVLLNTVEVTPTGTRTFTNRARASQLGDPRAADAFFTDVAGKGIALDAATSESIVSAAFLKDRLIVQFENSTWELVYTGNQVYPFTWQKINTELGGESNFSAIAFDQGVLAIGSTGVHLCNGTNVSRIDSKIPQEIFNIRNANEGVLRVYGIRDFYREMVYWSFPSATQTRYPNRVLVYNYVEQAWAEHDDTITCFGYFQPTNGVTWGSTTVLWGSDVLWSDGSTQPLFRQVVGGNQQGFVFVINSELPTNAAVLQISNFTTAGVITSYLHNLQQNDYIYIQDCQGITEANDRIFRIESVTDDTITLDLNGLVLTGTYSAGGVIARVSRVEFLSKQYNFYAKQGRNAYIQKVDFLIDTVAKLNDESAQITVDYSTSSSATLLLGAAAQTDTLVGSGNLDLSPYDLYPQEATQERVWHPVYLLAEGEVVQMKVYYNDELMLNQGSSMRPFQMHGFVIHTKPTSRLQ